MFAQERLSTNMAFLPWLPIEGRSRASFVGGADSDHSEPLSSTSAQSSDVALPALILAGKPIIFAPSRSNGAHWPARGRSKVLTIVLWPELGAQGLTLDGHLPPTSMRKRIWRSAGVVLCHPMRAPCRTHSAHVADADRSSVQSLMGQSLPSLPRCAIHSCFRSRGRPLALLVSGKASVGGIHRALLVVVAVRLFPRGHLGCPEFTSFGRLHVVPEKALVHGLGRPSVWISERPSALRTLLGRMRCA